MAEQLFRLGRLVATPGALEFGEKTLGEVIQRHRRGDWGDLDDFDKEQNRLALEQGNRLLSSYDIPGRGKLWVITEADRSATTVLLPEEY